MPVAVMRRVAVAARIAPTLLLLAVLVPALDRGGLWIDEVRSLTVAQDLATIAHALRHEEANMGLYYLMLRVWRWFGESDAWVRALSLLAALTCVPAMRAWGGVAAAGLLVFNASFLAAAHEVRGYAWMLAFALLASAALRPALRREGTRAQVAWVMWSALAFHAHALAAVMLAAHALVIAANARRLGGARALAMVAVSSALTLPLLAWQTAGDAQLEWIARRSLTRTLEAGLRGVGGGSTMGGGAWLAAALLASAVVMHRHGVRRGGRWLVLAWVPPLLLLLIDRGLHPLYLERYGVVAVPGLAVLIAAGARTALRTRALRTVALVGVAACVLWGLDLRPKEDWRGVAERIRARAQPGDVVVVYAYFCRPALERYLGDAPVEVLELASAEYPAAGGGRLPDPDLPRLERAARSRGRVWLVSSHARFAALGRDRQHRAIVDQLTGTLHADGRWRHRGVGLALFSR